MKVMKHVMEIILIILLFPILVAINAILFIDMMEYEDDLDRWY